MRSIDFGLDILTSSCIIDLGHCEHPPKSFLAVLATTRVMVLIGACNDLCNSEDFSVAKVGNSFCKFALFNYAKNMVGLTNYVLFYQRS